MITITGNKLRLRFVNQFKKISLLGRIQIITKRASAVREREGDPSVHSYLNLDRGTREPTSCLTCQHNDQQ